MEGSTADHGDTHAHGSNGSGEGRQVLAFAIAGAVAALGVVALVILFLAPGSGEPASEADQAGRATGFIFFDEFHATLLVSPGVVGENTVDLVLATHDGNSVSDASGVTITAAPPNGGAPAEYPAQPVEGSPGTYRATGVSFPSAGDWELGISAAVAGSDPVADTTVVSIGAR